MTKPLAGTLALITGSALAFGIPTAQAADPVGAEGHVTTNVAVTCSVSNNGDIAVTTTTSSAGIISATGTTTSSVTVFCNAPNSTVSVTATPMQQQGGSIPGDGFTNLIDFSGTVSPQGGGNQLAFYTDASLSGTVIGGPSQAYGPLQKGFDLHMSAVKAHANAIPVAGQYVGHVTITVTPS